MTENNNSKGEKNIATVKKQLLYKYVPFMIICKVTS